MGLILFLVINNYTLLTAPSLSLPLCNFCINIPHVYCSFRQVNMSDRLLPFAILPVLLCLSLVSLIINQSISLSLSCTHTQVRTHTHTHILAHFKDTSSLSNLFLRSIYKPTIKAKQQPPRKTSLKYILGDSHVQNPGVQSISCLTSCVSKQMTMSPT